jgi:hypothetical protein
MRTRHALFACLLCILCLTPSLAIFARADCPADPLADGQALLASGDYAGARAAFTCAAEADPAAIDAYRGRIEAALLSGDYADAVGDDTAILIHVLPETPDAFDTLIADYQSELASDPENITLLSGLSFAQWWVSDYAAAVETLDHLLALEPDNRYANAFRGSARYFNEAYEDGDADFAHALELEPDNPHLYFVLADAYTYGAGDTESALEAALKANELGLDTPRLNMILATAYLAAGDEAKATEYFAQHIESATTEMVETDPLAVGETVTLEIVPGRSYTLPLDVAAGETLTIITDSPDGAVDSMLVLVAPDGSLVTANDDTVELNAGLERQIAEEGTYRLLLTSFEGAGTGQVIVTRE